MSADSQHILSVLRDELRFLESGGYKQPIRAPWRIGLMFEDSPTCINYGDRRRSRSCEDCVLMQFVPSGEARSQEFPCQHIPLNEAGETVASLYSYGTQEELEQTVAQWLRVTIASLEKSLLPKAA